MIALVAALAGGANALPGKNKVDRNDLKRGAVTKRALKKKAVTTKALKDGAITEAKLADGSVTAPKIAPAEAPHVVGAAGEPDFGDGGDGDCVWRNVSSSSPDLSISGARPVSFARDQLGRVHLEGIAAAEDAPGGDGVCDFTDPGEIEEGVVFRLPSGYRPSGLVFATSVTGIGFVTPAAGATIESLTLPRGAAVGAESVFLDGVTYRPGP